MLFLGAEAAGVVYCTLQGGKTGTAQCEDSFGVQQFAGHAFVTVLCNTILHWSPAQRIFLPGGYGAGARG